MTPTIGRQAKSDGSFSVTTRADEPIDETKSPSWSYFTSTSNTATRLSPTFAGIEMKNAWTKSWREFAVAVASDVNAGCTAPELSDHFRGTNVTWCGIIDSNLSAEAQPYIVLDMPPEDQLLKSGHRLRADWLSLNVSADLRESALKLVPGDMIEFTARVADSMPVSFAYPVEIHVHEADLEAHIEISIVMVGFSVLRDHK